MTAGRHTRCDQKQPRSVRGKTGQGTGMGYRSVFRLSSRTEGACGRTANLGAGVSRSYRAENRRFEMANIGPSFLDERGDIAQP
jgi:hypothetical protein